MAAGLTVTFPASFRDRSGYEVMFWEGKRQEGQGSPNGGNSLQMSYIVLLSPLKWQEETNDKCQIFFLLKFCVAMTTPSSTGTFLKPWANQRIFLMEMFFLSYVNETVYLLWNCLSSKWFHLRLTFFSFSNFGLIIIQQTSIHINCFMAGGWYTSCHPISKMHIMEEGPGETPSALRCLSYLTNSFLTDIKHSAKDYC